MARQRDQGVDETARVEMRVAGGAAALRADSI